MNKPVFLFTILLTIFAATQTQPVDVNDGVVKQRYYDPTVFEQNLFPYYGGLQGQILQLVRTKDGTDNMFIVRPVKSGAPFTNENIDFTKKNSISISTDDTQPLNNIFEQEFNRIQIAAARLVDIQEIAKRKGTFSSDDNRIYAENLFELGQAAQNLANLQKNGKIKDFTPLLKPNIQAPLFTTASVQAENMASNQKVEEVTEQQLSEEHFLPPNPEDPYEDVSDTVAITAPKKDASVAEAKPVGLSIAGEGGVASSKPNAVALSGRNGLAVAAPKATAIAGVSAEEAAAFSVSIPNRNNLVIKNVNLSPQSSVYEDYSEDYGDLKSIRSISTTDSSPENGSPASVINRKHKDSSEIIGISGSKVDGSFVDKWKTMVAEDYATSARGASFSTKQSGRNFSQFSKSLKNIKF